MNEQKPKKSKISYILPYLLTTVLIVLIVWLIVGQFSNPVETWSESDIIRMLVTTSIRSKPQLKTLSITSLTSLLPIRTIRL